jgi:hypothetical protein
MSAYDPKRTSLVRNGVNCIPKIAIQLPLGQHLAMSASVTIRSAVQSDDDSIWRVIDPVFRAGESYPLPRDISRIDAFTYWRAPGNEVFVAENGGQIVGTYYLLICAPIAAEAAAMSQIAVTSSRPTPADAAWRGAGDVRGFPGTGARPRLHSHAVQFRHFEQRAGGKPVAKLRLCHRRYFARSFRAPDARIGRCLCDVSETLGYFANVCFWHLTDKSAAAVFVGYWGQSGQKSVLARDGLSANDPKRTCVSRARHRGVLGHQC